MDESHEGPRSLSGKGQPALCEECKTGASKYKCPGCSLRSCSLQCVNGHKRRTGCTGKGRLTDVVPLSQFDDNLINSDYNMLEDVKRMAESARRTRVKLCGNYHFRLPFPLKSLRSAALTRRTKILFHSTGMSKRVINQSNYNNRKKFISWTIEWRFHSTNVVLYDHGIHENTCLSEVIENHLIPGPWNHALRQFCDATLDSLKFFIRKYPKGSRSPYRQLNIRAPIRAQLANMVVLEYPVIYIFLPSHTCDFVVDDSIPVKSVIKEYIHDKPSSPKGVIFKEEEVEESLDPYVSDLMRSEYENSEIKKGSKHEMQSSLAVQGVKHAKSVSPSDTCAKSTAGNTVDRSYQRIQLTGCDDIDFELDPGLLDAYSNLIAETNIDNLLDFDGSVADEHDNLDVETFLLEEELEEGEIAEL